MDLAEAKQDTVPFEARARRLFHDVCLMQRVSLSTHQLLPEHDIWPGRKVEWTRVLSRERI